VLRTITEPKVVEYTLELIDDFVSPDVSVRTAFFAEELVTGESQVDVQPVIRHLENDSEVIRERASIILAMFLSQRCEPKDVVDAYVTWACEQLRAHRGNPNHTSLRAAVFSLSTFLTAPEAREAFHRHGGVRLLAPFVANAPGRNTQLIYESALCLWMCALTRSTAEEIALQTFRDLAQLVADNPREKILRVALACLRACLKTQPEREKELCEWLLATGILRTLDALQMTRITDPDLVADVEGLREVLNANFRVLSSFERYQQEVTSGRLKWGPMHSERFWKEHARVMEKDGFATLKQLLGILEGDGFFDDDQAPAEDASTSLAVACNDVGFFVQYYPNGKKLVEGLGAKPRIMALLAHASPEVQKHALLTVSKLLVGNWEFVAGANP